MCIIAHVPANIDIKKEWLENCFANNPDGAGFLVKTPEGELILKKGFFSFDTFYEEYKPYMGLESTLHFRIKTHGKIDIDNTHPFWVKENEIAFVHNGVISRVDIKEKDKSDTWNFNESILKPLAMEYGNKIIDNTIIQELIMNYIGASKLVFMQRGKATTWIFNKDAGETEDEIWFSNSTYKWNRTPVSNGHIYQSGESYYSRPYGKYSYFNGGVGDLVEIDKDIPNVCKKGEYGLITDVKPGGYEVEICSEVNKWADIITADIPKYLCKVVLS